MRYDSGSGIVIRYMCDCAVCAWVRMRSNCVQMHVCVRYSAALYSALQYGVCSARGYRHLCVASEPWTLAFPVRASQAVVIWVRLWWSLLDAAQRLMDAPGQGVGGDWELSLILPLFSWDTPQFDSLSDLNQDAVGVFITLGRRQGPLVNLPQVEAASLQRGQHLIHGWAHCIQEEKRKTDCNWLT